MTSLVIFALEGLLQTSDGRPADTGLHLYRAHHGQPGAHLVLISSATDLVARRFLHEHKIPPPSQVITDAADVDSWVIKCELIRRSGPYPVDYAVVPDPDLASELYYHGFSVLLFTDPRYARPEWRPDSTAPEPSPWMRFARELTATEKQRRSDTRIS